MSHSAVQTSLQLPSTSGRLGSTLFLTALAHGVVILGITFTSSLDSDYDESTSLKVSLVTGPATDRPESTDYIANQDQTGGGLDAQADRPTTSISTRDLMNVVGSPSGADLRDAVPREAAEAADVLLTRGDSDRSIAADPLAPDEVAAEPERAADMLTIQSQQTTAAEIDLAAAAPLNDNDAALGPATRRSILAGYLNDWRARVERIGTLNFPRSFLTNNSATRRPQLEVAIGPDGSLRDIVVQNSSGDRAVDQAAVSILRLAAPFDPLPDAIIAEYGELRFAYEWDFIEGNE